MNLVRAQRCVQFTDLGESILLQFAGEPDECWPEPPMHIRDLPVHQPADEHVRRISQEASQREDLVAHRVTPPVSANALADHGVGECRDRSVRRLENDPMPLEKLQRGSAIHRACLWHYSHTPRRSDEIGS
jgi:hypothetical protein